MANPNPPPPPEHSRFKKGQSGNPKGRARKFISTLKEQGYKQSEIIDCQLVMLSMTVEELTKVWENPNATVLEKAVASAIRNDIKKGKLDSIEVMLSRAYGRPVARQELSGAGGEPLFPVQFVVKDEQTLSDIKKLTQ